MLRSLPSPVMGSEDAVERLPASISLDDSISCQEKIVQQCYPDVRFTIPRALPLLNVLLRTNRWARRSEQKALSWEIFGILGGRRWDAPMARARVTVERHSTGRADTDNLIAKGLMDVLCVPSKIHPFGLGIIADDNPDACEFLMRAVKVAHRRDHKTVVTIEALAD
jgi:hypothetical protein